MLPVLVWFLMPCSWNIDQTHCPTQSQVADDFKFKVHVQQFLCCAEIQSGHQRKVKHELQCNNIRKQILVGRTICRFLCVWHGTSHTGPWS